jgi:hypothetical protein
VRPGFPVVVESDDANNGFTAPGQILLTVAP